MKVIFKTSIFFVFLVSLFLVPDFVKSAGVSPTALIVPSGAEIADLKCCQVEFLDINGDVAEDGAPFFGEYLLHTKDEFVNPYCDDLNNLKKHQPNAGQLLTWEQIDLTECGINPTPAGDNLGGKFTEFNFSATYKFDVCGLEDGGQKIMLPSAVVGGNKNYKISESDWGTFGLSGVKCIKKDFSLVCDSGITCPIGAYCNKGDEGNSCKFFPNCDGDSDCSLPSALTVGVTRPYKCESLEIDSTPIGICVFVESASNDCGCPFGLDSGITGCGSPFCISQTNETGLCSKPDVDGGIYKCTELDVGGVPATYCGESLNCWLGSREAPDGDPKSETYGKTKTYVVGDGSKSATCCVNNKCGSKIDLCLNDYVDAKTCPPGYAFDPNKKICGVGCPIDASFACKTDEDCGKKFTKPGEEYKCVNVEDYESDTIAKLNEEQLKICNTSDMGRVCKKTKSEAGGAVGGGYEGVEFEYLDVSGLSQLKTTSVPNLIGNLIKTAMGLMGSVGLVMFVYGGLLWMTAAGNSEHQKKAMNVLLWSSMGIIVILASYVIVSFVFKAFGL
ncbi:MAG: pilin [Candidatus Magasanikbacteria bacterium]